MKTRKIGRGRPRKGSGPTKSQSVLLRVDPEEKQAFATAAFAAGLAVSAWMRERLRWAAAKELAAMSRPVPFLDRE